MAAGSLRRIEVDEGTRFIGVTFIYLFIALLITAGISLGLGAIMNSVLGSALYGGDEEAFNNALTPYLVMMIVSAISTIVFTIWIRIAMARGGRGILIPCILYTVSMGVLLSSFSLFLPFYDLALAVGITSVAFGGMALIGILGGNKIRWFGLIGFGLLIGAMLIGLTSFIWYLLAPNFYNIIYSLIMGIMLIAVLLITAYDVYNMKRIADSGTGTNNLAMYCAFNLYVDFIYILVRVIIFLARIRR